MVALAFAVQLFGARGFAAGVDSGKAHGETGAVAETAPEVSEMVEKDFKLRSLGTLHITNLRGSIQVMGWAQDRIRVRSRRFARVGGGQDAARLLRAMDFRYREFGGDIELAAEYGRGLGIQDRLRERTDPRTSMEMIVSAPASIRLRVWGADDPITVKGWRAPIEVRSGRGRIEVEEMSGDQVTLACPECSMSLRDIESNVRCMGGSGEVRLDGVRGSSIYAETRAGRQLLKGVRGAQLYVSRTGAIEGDGLSGKLEFHSESGAIRVERFRGFASGRTHSGSVSISAEEWHYEDRALFESATGNIELTLPPRFSGDVDLWSVRGATSVEFPLDSMALRPPYGPLPASHLLGRVGDGGEQLRIFSVSGDVRLKRGGGTGTAPIFR